MALDYPKVVTKVMTLDIVPTFDLYDRANSFFAEKYWHWFFLIQPYPMPEEMSESHHELESGSPTVLPAKHT